MLYIYMAQTKKKATRKPRKAPKTANNAKRKVGGQTGNKNAEKWTEEKALELGNELIKFLNTEGTDNLFKKDFLFKHGLYNDVVNHLCDKFPLFSELIKKADEIQLHKLDKYGIMGELNPAMVIFVQKNCHGRRDKQDIDHTVNTVPGIKLNRVKAKKKGE